MMDGTVGHTEYLDIALVYYIYKGLCHRKVGLLFCDYSSERLRTGPGS